MLEKSSLAVIRGVLAIYKLQTGDEQEGWCTKHLNGCGFSSVDASFGTEMALKITGGENLSKKQLEACRKMMRKYVGQLVRIANSRRTDGGSPES